jgi:hypothetical protein
MSVIQNQQISLLKFLSLNGVEITNHGRTVGISQTLSVSDLQTDSGRIRRFYKKNKKVLNFNFTYVPGSIEKTVDGRQARDFIYNLALNSPLVAVEYKDSPDGYPLFFNGFITNYQESVVRRDLKTQCIYYDVQFELEEQ